MKKKRIILLSAAAAVVLVGVSLGVYLWPQRIERTFEDAALWYADSNQTWERSEGFRADAADVTLALTKRRHLTAPDQYTGTITINGTAYTISGRTYGGFFDTWKEKFEEDTQDTIYLSAETTRMYEAFPGVSIPVPDVVVTLIASRDFERFYLSESPSRYEGAQERFIHYYIHPAGSEEEARAVYKSLEGTD